MKRIILAILMLMLLTGCGVFNLDGWITPADDEFIACIEELNTPQKIGDYMIKNFTYKAHDFTAQSPYELFLYEKGDCDEFAKFGILIADYHNYETYQIKIFDNTLYTHYVAVYDEDIWLSITDNQYYSFGYDSFEEIVNHVCNRRNKEWTKYIVYDYWNDIIETGYNN